MSALQECDPSLWELFDIDMSSKRGMTRFQVLQPLDNGKIIEICRISGTCPVATMQGVSDKICKAALIMNALGWREVGVLDDAP